MFGKQAAIFLYAVSPAHVALARHIDQRAIYSALRGIKG